MKNTLHQEILSWTVFALALALLYFGCRCRYDVYYDQNSQPPPILAPLAVGDAPDGTELAPPSLPAPSSEQISDSDLMVNATFTGVVRRDGNLFWTYNPAEKQAKQACPT